MLKFLIYTVAVAVIAVLGFDTFQAFTGKATLPTLVETAVGWAAILAIAVTAFVKSVSGSFGSFSFRRKSNKVTAEDVKDSVDSVSSTVDDISNTVDSVERNTDTILDKLSDIADRLGPVPDGYVATVNTFDENGKLVKVYDLQPSDSYEEALSDARDSIRARAEEGNPVVEPRITVAPVFFPGDN